MKTIQTTAMTLMFTLFAATVALAQNPTLKLAEGEQSATVQTDTHPQSYGISLYRVQESMKLRLNLHKQAGERAAVRLLDQYGQVLHEDRVGRHAQKYACEFDFSEIGDGAYTVEVDNGGEVTRKKINLSTSEAVHAPARNLVAVHK